MFDCPRLHHLSIMRRSARTNFNWAGTAAEGVDLVGCDTPAGERLTQMAEFFQVKAAASGASGE
jgi:hypothetical protein